MKEPQRLLARINPISVNLQSSTAITGMVLKAEDIAASLAGLERGPYLLIRYLWCQDHTVAKELNELLLKEIKHMALKKNWKYKNDTIKLSTFINVAIRELEHVNLCKSCNGTGVKTNKMCLPCYGTGKIKFSQSNCARVCGIKPSNWKLYWAGKYQDVCLLISEWNERGIDHLLSRL
jgi:hypothetical protein